MFGGGACGALVLTLAAAPPQGVLLDGVAAVVEREVITRSEVDRAARISMVRHGAGLEAASATVDGGLMNAVLNMLVAEELVLQDGRRRRVAPEADDEVGRRAALFRARVGGDRAYQEFLRRTHSSEAEMQEVFRREARVDVLLSARMDAPVPLEDEVTALVRATPALQAMGATRARLHARDLLMQKARDEAAQRYIQELRAKTVLRFPPPANLPVAP